MKTDDVLRLKATPSTTELLFNAKLSSTGESYNANVSSKLEMAADYNKLIEDTLPRINHVMLKGDKASSDLYLQDAMDTITSQEIDQIIFGGE